MKRSGRGWDSTLHRARPWKMTVNCVCLRLYSSHRLTIVKAPGSGQQKKISLSGSKIQIMHRNYISIKHLQQQGAQQRLRPAPVL